MRQILKLTGSAIGPKLNLIASGQEEGITFDLSVIRNQQMNNAIGDSGSIDLSVNSLSGSGALTLSVANLPYYSGFHKEPSSWVVVPTTGGYTQYPTFCHNIDDVAKTITLKDNSIRFPVGTKIALYNPFLNYRFSGTQTSSASIDTGDLSGWGDKYCGGGPLFKVGSTYKWLFYALTTGTPSNYNQIGLATSTDGQTWTVQNSGGVWISRTQADCSSLNPTGNIGQVDGSYYCLVSCTNKTTGLGEVKIMYFNSDVSAISFSSALKTNAASGSIVKVGNNYHMLYVDISTGISYRSIMAAKSTNLEGPYTDYQNIAYAASCPTGACWGSACDSPNIYKVGNKVFGVFGAQGASGVYSHGLGNVNRQHVLLDFNPITETWSISPKGAVLINPLDWGNTGSSNYSWATDHDGQGQNLFIDGNTAFFSNTFNAGTDTYAATMTILQNFKPVLSRKLLLDATTGAAAPTPPVAKSYVVGLFARNNTNYNNYLSYDKGASFAMNQDLSTKSTGLTYWSSQHISPDASHMILCGYSGSTRYTAWSHNSGVTWDVSTTNNPTEYGNVRCSDDGNIMAQGSFDNDAAKGIFWSKNGGTTWAFWEPSVGADNKKYVNPQMSGNGKYMLSTSQYSTSAVKAIMSPNYGDQCCYVVDQDNPSYPFDDAYFPYTNNTMSYNGKYQINAGYGVYQNSSDYGYSWYSIYSATKSTSYYVFPRCSSDGKYQVYQRYIDSSMFASSDYGVTWSQIGNAYEGKWTNWYLSNDGMNMITLRPPSNWSDNYPKAVWKCSGFNLGSWTNTKTFDVSILTAEMSSDGSLFVVELGDGSIYYSENGGTTFTKSSFVNPLAPTTFMYLRIN